MRLAAELRPNPVGQLRVLPRPPSLIKGMNREVRKEDRKRGVEGKGWKRGKREKRTRQKEGMWKDKSAVYYLVRPCYC